MNMNRIELKKVKTCYDYEEDYFIIDGKPIVVWLDEFLGNSECESLKKMGSMLGLVPAWAGHLLGEGENEFVWELVDSISDENVPILVCEDDCDLSCIVIVVHVRKTAEYVFWDKIGYKDRSGILWISEMNWAFDVGEYNKVTEEYRNLKNENLGR